MAQDMAYYQQTTVTVAFLDKRGNPAPVEGAPVWQTNNTDVLALTPAEDGMSCLVKAVGALGSANVSVTGDADLGEGVVDVIGLLEFNIGPGTAETAAVTAGAVEDQPAPEQPLPGEPGVPTHPIVLPPEVIHH